MSHLTSYTVYSPHAGKRGVLSKVQQINIYKRDKNIERHLIIGDWTGTYHYIYIY